MKLSDFDYDLPEDRIAQEPTTDRAASRLLVLDRRSGDIEDGSFRDLVSYLPEETVLIFNDTAVIPARLTGTREHTGGRAEVFLVERVDDPLEPLAGTGWGDWICLVRASKAIRAGQRILLGNEAVAEIREVRGDGLFVVSLEGGGELRNVLEQCGATPLPPYIRRAPDAEDIERYQTVYAKRAGAVAAPTAGLHFTPEILEQLESAGHRVCYLTLHVGPGTFLPVRSENLDEHRMHQEVFEIPDTTASAVNEAAATGRTVLAVGTTSCRALEAAWGPDGLRPGRGSTDLFIRPGYEPGVVSALLTNFHLPRSTLLMLVCAFAGRERVLAAYQHAVERQYRFYSYGDAMLVR